MISSRSELIYFLNIVLFNYMSWDTFVQRLHAKKVSKKAWLCEICHESGTRIDFFLCLNFCIVLTSGVRFESFKQIERINSWIFLSAKLDVKLDVFWYSSDKGRVSLTGLQIKLWLTFQHFFTIMKNVSVHAILCLN